MPERAIHDESACTIRVSCSQADFSDLLAQLHATASPNQIGVEVAYRPQRRRAASTPTPVCGLAVSAADDVVAVVTATLTLLGLVLPVWLSRRKTPGEVTITTRDGSSRTLKGEFTKKQNDELIHALTKELPHQGEHGSDSATPPEQPAEEEQSHE